MIAFYVWTDTLLMNAVRVKTGSFPEEQADLFVLKNERITPALYESAAQSGVFRTVLWIEEPERRLPLRLHKLTKLLCRPYYARGFAAQLAPFAENRYRLFFTGALWAFTLFVYGPLEARNPGLKIAFLEEGAASYNGLQSLLSCDALGKTRSALYRFFFYRKGYPKAVGALAEIYLYYPEGAQNTEGLTTHQIRFADEKTEAIRSCITETLLLEKIRQRPVLFFLQPEPKQDWPITLENIKRAAEIFGPDRVAVKTHPAEPNQPWLSDVPPGVSIENRSFSMDLVVDQIPWDEKILIAKGTSCFFYPLYMCRCRPRILAIYDMYPEDPEREIPAALTARLKSLYAEPERIQTAASSAEYEQVLKLFQKEREGNPSC